MTNFLYRHDELQDAKSRESPEITKLKKEIHEIRNLLAQNTKENALLSKEIENLKVFQPISTFTITKLRRCVLAFTSLL